MANDLTTPLKQRKARQTRRRLAGDRHFQFPVTRAAAFLIVALVGGAALRVVWINEPQGGRPVAEADISSQRTPNSVVQDVSDRPVNPTASTQDAADTPGGPQITEIDDDTPTALAAAEPAMIAPAAPYAALPALLENTQYGSIPRIGPRGETPFASYARAAAGSSNTGAPLVAIVVGGLGLSERSTYDAIESLPSTVTLAFAPYGRDLARAGASARADGHEIMLEIPLEPFDYPNTDPGPHTLLTGQPPRVNLDNLFWLMARLEAYTGIVNNMGARFSASASDFAPIMEEFGTRGLGFLDDGSSNRTLSGPLADKNRVPYARAGVQLDATPTRTAILEALDELVAAAGENGQAIGMISALPVSIETVAGWARRLDDEVALLVPVSKLMADD